MRKIAHSICGSLRRAGDFASRYDQGRFAVLIGSASEIQAENLAENIANKVRNLSIHHPRSPVGRFLTLSYGVSSETPDWTATSSSLLARAEEQQASNRPSADGETEQSGEAASA
jgi:PleD family two-component response regulator